MSGKFDCHHCGVHQPEFERMATLIEEMDKGFRFWKEAAFKNGEEMLRLHTLFKTLTEKQQSVSGEDIVPQEGQAPKCPRCLKEFKPGEISRMLDDTINTPQLYHSECYDSIAREIERKKEIYRDKPYKPS